MPYKYNLALSITENLIHLINLNYTNPANERMTAQDVTFGLPTVITPGAGNGNCNTQVIVSGIQARGFIGNAIVYYNRLAVADSVPAVIPKALYIYNVDTTATIQAAIREKFNLVGSEVTFSGPANPPTAGNSANYTVTAVDNGYIYVPGSQMVVTVSNRQGVNP